MLTLVNISPLDLVWCWGESCEVRGCPRACSTRSQGARRKWPQVSITASLATFISLFGLPRVNKTRPGWSWSVGKIYKYIDKLFTRGKLKGGCRLAKLSRPCHIWLCNFSWVPLKLKKNKFLSFKLFTFVWNKNIFPLLSIPRHSYLLFTRGGCANKINRFTTYPAKGLISKTSDQ